MLIAAVLGDRRDRPGRLSVDRALGAERSGPAWALAALAAGIIGYVGARVVNEAELEAAQAPLAEAEEPSPAPAAAATE